MTPITTLIIDDEPFGRTALAAIIKEHFPELTLLGTASDAPEALRLINQYEPELVFLDIQLPAMNAFDMLKQCKMAFYLVFVTGDNSFAAQSYQCGAVGYILKPVSLQEVNRVIQKVKIQRKIDQVAQPLTSYRSGQLPVRKISFPSAEGLQLLNPDRIIRCESDGSYVHVFMEGGACIMLSRNLKNIEAKIHDFNFFRSHHSHLVNLNAVEQYIKVDGCFLVMSDGSQVPVARNRRNALMARLNNS
jgi:two-component system, LytTR family, response regulator